MIAGNDEKRDSSLGKGVQALIRHVNDLPGDTTPTEEVATVNHEIGPGLLGITEDAIKVVEEVGASSPSLHSRVEGEVKAEVSVPEQQYPETGVVQNSRSKRIFLPTWRVAVDHVSQHTCSYNIVCDDAYPVELSSLSEFALLDFTGCGQGDTRIRFGPASNIITFKQSAFSAPKAR